MQLPSSLSCLLCKNPKLNIAQYFHKKRKIMLVWLTTSPCALVVQKDNHILVCIKRIVARMSKEVILPLLLCLAETPLRVLHPALRLCSGFCYHRKLEGWLLWEAARNLLHVWQKQCQLTPRWTCCWPRLSPSETVEAALR